MRYLGGKAKIRKPLCAEIAKYRKPGQIVWEPFCGGLNSAVGHGGPVICSDASLPLISLLNAVRGGWDPPSVVTAEQHAAAKKGALPDPLGAFLRFGCSFGGDPRGGFACQTTKANAGQSRRALLRDASIPALVWHADFLAIEPCSFDALIYCDPPYAGRAGYGIPFDHNIFIDRVIDWACHGVTVLVSEYSFPIGELVWEKERGAAIRGAGAEKTHVERLYLVRL